MSKAEARHENRFLRFNDARRLITAQLSEDAFAEVRAAITQRAKLFPSDGETRYDQRRADALLDICRGGGYRGGDGAVRGRVTVWVLGRVRRQTAQAQAAVAAVAGTVWVGVPVTLGHVAGRVRVGGPTSSSWPTPISRSCGAVPAERK